MSTMLRLSGKVSHWNYARGFGFVQTADEHELFLNIADSRIAFSLSTHGLPKKPSSSAG